MHRAGLLVNTVTEVFSFKPSNGYNFSPLLPMMET